MHPAFFYVVHTLEVEQRRMGSYLPDPDPSVDRVPRAISSPPAPRSRPGRSLRTTVALRVAVSRRRLQRRLGGSAA